MSIRALGDRLFRHGAACIKSICRRQYNTTVATIGEQINALPSTSGGAGRASVTNNLQLSPRNFALRNVGLQVGLHARRILIDNVLNRVTNSLAAELRKKAARRLLFGDSVPFFAFVGVTLASGTGIITKEEELEGVCWEIREAISKIKWNDFDINQEEFESQPIRLKDLELGKPIGKGANAVVYTANLNRSDLVKGHFSYKIQTSKCNEYHISNYPFAVKMMFNYDIQSNAMAILRAMYRETVPASSYHSNVGITDWELSLNSHRRILPSHPNVVAMFSVFTDYVTELEDAKNLYPAALPKRIHPDGEGRNMSLFLLMKRYDCSLEDYLKTRDQICVRTSILLLTQLLEGVAHMMSHGIAHRDLKSDNLLLDLTEPEVPVLVITDFGCCLADKAHGLFLPFTSYDIDRGGNAALMAPEIITQTPGTFSVLNYTKSDLWAAGTIAYELFGNGNPFYQKKLRNVDYIEEALPELGEDVPPLIRALVKNLLKRSPGKRIDAETAANICQLFLWAPSSWLKAENTKYPSSSEILQWLLSLTTKVLCEARLNFPSYNHQVVEESTQASPGISENVQRKGRRTFPEYLLIASFLRRAKLANIKAALTWIHDNL